MNIDDAYENSIIASEREDWPMLAQCIDVMQAWLVSDEAQEYARSSTNAVRDYVSMLILAHGHNMTIAKI